MPRILVQALVALVTSAIALWVASLFLDGMSITPVGIVTASILFTVFSLLLTPVVRSLMEQYADRASILVGVVVSFLALLVTDLLSDNLDIEGLGTWVMATVLVWAAAIVTRLILGTLFKEHLGE